LTEQDELFTRNPDFIFRRIIDETILVPVHRDLAEMDCIYTLNELGALLWEKLETPASKIELRKRFWTLMTLRKKPPRRIWTAFWKRCKASARC